MTYPYILTNESIVVVSDGTPITVSVTSPQYKPLKKALEGKNWKDVPKYLTIDSTLEDYAKGLPAELKTRVEAMARDGKDPKPLYKFWARLQKNPSFRSVEQLWRFLQNAGIPLTPEGRFLAYKGVNTDLKDKHTGTFDNSPGAINKLPRNQVSDDPSVECHVGFHVGALSYARDFGARVVVCEVDPENVVCVPNDHQFMKMRVCEYRVLGFHNGQLLPSEVIEKKEMPSKGKSHSGAPAPKPTAPEPAVKEAPPAKKPSTKVPTLEELLAMPMDALRAFATNKMKIVGAGHLKGGKSVLAQHILAAAASKR